MVLRSVVGHVAACRAGSETIRRYQPLRYTRFERRERSNGSPTRRTRRKLIVQEREGLDRQTLRYARFGSCGPLPITATRP